MKSIAISHIKAVVIKTSSVQLCDVTGVNDRSRHEQLFSLRDSLQICNFLFFKYRTSLFFRVWVLVYSALCYVWSLCVLPSWFISYYVKKVVRLDVTVEENIVATNNRSIKHGQCSDTIVWGSSLKLYEKRNKVRLPDVSKR